MVVPTPESTHQTAHELEMQRVQLANAKLSRAELRLKIAAGAVGIVLAIAALFGWQAKQSDDEVRQVTNEASNVQDQNAAASQSASRQLSHLSADNANLHAENDSLSSQLAAPSATSAPQSGESATDAAGAIYHQGKVALANGGDNIVLDAAPNDPRWGATQSPNPFSAPALWLSGNDLTFGSVDIAKLNEGETADYATCSARTTYTDVLRIPVASLSDRPTLCLRFSQFGTFRVVDRSKDSITLEITTWTNA